MPNNAYATETSASILWVFHACMSIGTHVLNRKMYNYQVSLQEVQYSSIIMRVFKCSHWRLNTVYFCAIVTPALCWFQCCEPGHCPAPSQARCDSDGPRTFPHILLHCDTFADFSAVNLATAQPQAKHVVIVMDHGHSLIFYYIVTPLLISVLWT